MLALWLWPVAVALAKVAVPHSPLRGTTEAMGVPLTSADTMPM